jgi:uncharacterized protein affecting Mg2+/Co2+ transport
MMRIGTGTQSIFLERKASRNNDRLVFSTTVTFPKIADYHKIVEGAMALPAFTAISPLK